MDTNHIPFEDSERHLASAQKLIQEAQELLKSPRHEDFPTKNRHKNKMFVEIVMYGLPLLVVLFFFVWGILDATGVVEPSILNVGVISAVIYFPLIFFALIKIRRNDK